MDFSKSGLKGFVVNEPKYDYLKEKRVKASSRSTNYS